MKAIQRFFSKQKFLIVDDGGASRIAVARALADLGVPAAQMSLTGRFDAAVELAQKTSYTVLICEYELGKNCGLELIDLLPNLALTVIITKNQSEAAEARAAESNVDIFLKKLFTMESLKSALIAYFQGESDDFSKEAIRAEASLSVLGSIERARASHARAGQYDKLGYRALVGLYNGLIAQGEKADAYAILRRLVLNFPVHPPRLLDVLRLAIETRHLEDIESYYEIFLRLDDKSIEHVKAVCAAMIISAKSRLRDGDVARAVDLFKKVAVTSGKSSTFLRLITEALLAEKKHIEADSFLTLFRPEDRESAEFLALDYRVFARMRPLHEVLQRGRELAKSGVQHPDIYRVRIEACIQAGHHSEAESLALDAGRIWPLRIKDYADLLA